MCAQVLMLERDYIYRVGKVSGQQFWRASYGGQVQQNVSDYLVSYPFLAELPVIQLNIHP